MAAGATVSAGAGWQDFTPSSDDGWQDLQPKGNGPRATAQPKQPGMLAHIGSEISNRIGINMSPEDVSAFGSKLGSDLAAIPKSIPHMLGGGLLADPDVNHYLESRRASEQHNQEQKQAGYSVPYRRVLTPIAENIGVNVHGMEESAKEGSTGGVLGHAAAVPVAIAATHAATESAPAIGRVSSKVGAAAREITPKQAAQTVGGAAGAGLGKGYLSVPGAYYGAKGAGSLTEGILGKERANAPIFPRKVPGGELRDIPTSAARPAAETGEALGSIPVPKQSPSAPPPTQEPLIEPRIAKPSVGPKLGEQLNEGLGNNPVTVKPGVKIRDQFRESSEPLIDPVSGEPVKRLWPDRPSRIAKPENLGFDNTIQIGPDLGEQVRAEKPAVPRSGERRARVRSPEEEAFTQKRVRGEVSDKEVEDWINSRSDPIGQDLPKGFTPVESSALKGYKYDPLAREFEYITKDGQHYVRGDVSPDAAAQFEQEGPQSWGKAWHGLRNNPEGGVGQYKVLNGKRVPVNPAELKEPGTPIIAKRKAGMISKPSTESGDLTPILEEMLRQTKKKP